MTSDLHDADTPGRSHGAFSRLFALGVYFDVLGYPRGSEGREGSGRLYSGALWSFFLSGCLAGVLADYPPMVFAAVMLSLTGFLGLVQILTDFGYGFLSTDDERILAHLPIPSSTRFAARLASLGTLLAFHVIHGSLIPAIVVGFRSSAGILATLSYLAVAALLVATLGGVVVVIYLSIIQWSRIRRFRELLVWVQVFATSATFLLIFAFPYLGEIQSVGQRLLDAAWIPSSWFAHLFGILSGEDGSATRALFAIVTPIVLLLPLVGVARGYSGLLSRVSAAARSKDKPRGLRSRLKWLEPPERAVFRFVLANMKRDRGFRTRAYPLLALPLLVLLAGSGDRHPLFFVMMIQLPAIYLPFFVSFLPYTDSPEGAWIFRAIPMGTKHHVVLGTQLAFILALIVPAYTLVAGTLCFVWDPVSAILHTLVAASMAILLITHDLTQMEAMPFTEPFSTAFDGQIGADLYGRLLVLGLMAFVQFLLLSSPLGTLALALFLLGASAFLRKRYRREGSVPVEGAV